MAELSLRAWAVSTLVEPGDTARLVALLPRVSGGRVQVRTGYARGRDLVRVGEVLACRVREVQLLLAECVSSEDDLVTVPDQPSDGDPIDGLPRGKRAAVVDLAWRLAAQHDDLGAGPSDADRPSEGLAGAVLALLAERAAAPDDHQERIGRDLREAAKAADRPGDRDLAETVGQTGLLVADAAAGPAQAAAARYAAAALADVCALALWVQPRVTRSGVGGLSPAPDGWSDADVARNDFTALESGRLAVAEDDRQAAGMLCAALEGRPARWGTYHPHPAYAAAAWALVWSQALESAMDSGARLAVAAPPAVVALGALRTLDAAVSECPEGLAGLAQRAEAVELADRARTLLEHIRDH